MTQLYQWYSSFFIFSCAVVMVGANLESGSRRGSETREKLLDAAETSVLEIVTKHRNNKRV